MTVKLEDPRYAGMSSAEFSREALCFPEIVLSLDHEPVRLSFESQVQGEPPVTLLILRIWPVL